MGEETPPAVQCTTDTGAELTESDALDLKSGSDQVPSPAQDGGKDASASGQDLNRAARRLQQADITASEPREHPESEGHSVHEKGHAGPHEQGEDTEAFAKPPLAQPVNQRVNEATSAPGEDPTICRPSSPDAFTDSGAGSPELSLQEQPLYAPLPPDSKSIRLLSLQPSRQRDDPIICSLITVDLDDKTTSYEAALAALDTWTGEANSEKLRIGSFRHIFWSFWNLYSEDVPDVSNDGMAERIATDEDLSAVCDRLLDGGGKDGDGIELADRFRWGDYIALSYVWGDQSTKKEIILNGSSFLVGRNLYDALLRLRQSWEVSARGLKVWIDAICINQDDLVERALEVKKMTLIYSEALFVRGWLGPASDELVPDFETVHKVFAFADYLAYQREIEQAPVTKSSWEEEGAMPTEFSGRMLFALKAQKAASKIATGVEMTQEYISASYSIMAALHDLPYWNRLWMMQEIAVSPSLCFWYGSHSIAAEELRCLFEVVCRTADVPITDAQFIDLRQKRPLQSLVMARLIKKLNRLREMVQDQYSLDIASECEYIMNVVDQARASYATDERDKVYGLLSLLPLGLASKIQPSYDPSWTWQMTWMEFSTACLEYNKRLDLLARCSKPRLDDDGIATWALDLTSVEARTGRTAASRKEIDGSAGDSNAVLPGTSLSMQFVSSSDRGLQSPFRFSKDGRVLHCTAVFVDSVGTVASRLHRESAGDGFSSTFDSSGTAPPQEDKERTRLSLARTFYGKFDYQFSDGVSILDIPWWAGEDAVVQDDHKPRAAHILWDTKDKAAPMHWTSAILQTGSAFVWAERLSAFGDFVVRGRPLKEYFDREDAMCYDWLEFLNNLFPIHHCMNGRHIFNTEEGLVGSVVKEARQGDRIAVIYGCDVPVVLRPKGGKYQLIGGCFLDGLMNGEAADLVRKWEVTPEEISIC